MWVRVWWSGEPRHCLARVWEGRGEREGKPHLTFNNLNATSTNYHHHPQSWRQLLVSMPCIKVKESYLPQIMMKIIAGKRWQTRSTKKEDWHNHPFGPFKLSSAEVVINLLKLWIWISVNLKICFRLKTWRPGGGNLSVIEEEEGKGPGSSSTGNLP